jgi:NADPH:quinone reductase-like Zn-dependent oxidoreductase
VCSALQIALVDLLRSWNVYPDSVTGHSSGEIAAAYASGALSMEDAMKVAYYRGLCASKILASNEVRGSMIAVGVSAEVIEPYISRLVSGKVDVACINSPSSVTVSGDAEAIAELADRLKEKSIFYRRLAVDVAYHSHHMELVADEYLSAIATISPRDQHANTEEACQPFSVSMFSSVTGKSILPEELGPRYWVSNLLQQVNFSESLRTLCFETNPWHHHAGILHGRKGKRTRSAQKASVDCLVEIGPHSALSGPVKQILQTNVKLSAADISYLSILTRNKDAVKSALGAASSLVSKNYPLDIGAINFAKGAATQRQPRLLVDMPPYRWNHTRSYWAEPRLSKAFRYRSQPRTDLLGTSDNIACPFEPRWRNLIRTSEIPWILEHRIQSDIVFPAAGYLCMATEAITQISGSSQSLSAVILKNVSIHSALIVTEASEVEVLTSLTSHGESRMHDSEKWYRFHIYSVSKENKWTEHCSGDINVESQLNGPGDVTVHHSERSTIHALSPKPQGIRVVNVGRLYDRLQKAGLEYGPYFANMTSAHATDTGRCFAEITIPDTAALMPMNFQYPLLLHPCTLDNVFHTIFAALPEGMGVEKGPLIPVSLDYMRLSYQITSLPGDRLNVCTDVRPSSRGQIVASIVVAENISQMCSLNPKISISGLRCTQLEVAPSMSENSKTIPIAYGIEWRADPGFITPDDLSFILQKNGVSQERLASRNEYDYYVTVLIQNAVEAFKEEHSQKPDLIYDKYRSSLSDMILVQAIDESNLFDKIILTNKAPSSSMGTLISMIDVYLASLSQIEDESFTQLHEELFNAYHEVISMDRAYMAAVEFIKLIGFKKPEMSILQLCDGTVRPLTIFLEALLANISSEETNFPPFRKYTFTYENEEGYDRAKLSLEKWTKWIDFIKLDNARGAADSFTPGILNPSYDVIILPNGFHSFNSSLEVLTICRSMLNPSGNLIIVDPLRPQESILDNFLTTALYLWPIGNFEPPRGLEGDGSDLDDMIEKAGLSSKRDATHNHRQADHVEGFIICQPGQEARLIDKEFLVIQPGDDDISMAECLRYDLVGICPKVETSCLAAANARGKVCIVINDEHENILASPGFETLSKLKEIFLYSSGVLLISRGGAIDPKFPEYGLDVGFARTARSESAVKPIITLDLDAQSPLMNQRSAELITILLHKCFSRVNSGDMDTEYAERNGVILIPRAIERSDINRDLSHVSESEIQCEQHFRQIEKPIRVSRPNNHNIHPHLAADFENSSPPPTGYVRIEVMAFGLGEWDIQEDADEFNSRGTLGLECSGWVLAIGPEVYSLSIGDRVTCLGAGTARSYYQDRESAFQKVGDFMTYEMAAALPVEYTTAYYIMHYLTRARPEELVLIWGAASLLGQAMLEMCCIGETGILATVIDPSQKEFLLSRFDIPPEMVLVEGLDDILMKVLEITSGKKARVVIATAKRSHRVYRELVKCVAPFGHFVQISSHSDERKDTDHAWSTSRNISLSRFNILDFQKNRGDLTRQIWPKVVQLFNEGKLQGPLSLSVYKISDLAQALSAVFAERHVVVTAVDNEIIQVSPSLVLFKGRKDQLSFLDDTAEGLTRYIPTRRIIPSSRWTWGYRTRNSTMDGGKGRKKSHPAEPKRSSKGFCAVHHS